MTQEKDGKIYCKKCGAWVVPENGECPRCGYRLVGSNKKGLYMLIGLIIFILILIFLLG